MTKREHARAGAEIAWWIMVLGTAFAAGLVANRVLEAVLALFAELLHFSW